MNRLALYTLIAVFGGSLTNLIAHPSTDARLSKLEKEMKDVYLESNEGTKGARFADGRVPASDADWTLEGEALLFHIKEGGTEWAIVFNKGTPPQQGEVHTLPFGWDWGLRVGAARHFAHDDIDLGLVYTYYRTGNSRKVSAPFATPDGTEAPEGAAGPAGFSDASFSGKFSYNCLDLNLGKSFFVSRSLSLRPSCGLKNVWIKQTFKLRDHNYVDASETFAPVVGTVDITARDSNELWGIGPQLGLDLNWALCANFRIISAVQGALLQSYIEVDHYGKIVISPEGSESTIGNNDLSANIHRFVPFAKCLLGLGWAKDFNDRKQHLDISINWEIDYFWRENQMLNITNSTVPVPTFSSDESVRLLIQRLSEDVGLYGVSFKLQLDF